MIILAITIHYVIEYSEGLGDYNCPQKCKVEHSHIISKKQREKVSNEIREFSSRISIQRREQEKDSIRIK